MAKPIDRNAKVFVAGHRGLVGSAIVRRLEQDGFTNIVTRSHSELDLTDQAATRRFFAEQEPRYVFLAAAKVGGIHANDRYRADFVRINLQIETNVIEAAHHFGVQRLMFLGSSCIYPKLAPQPMKEAHLLTGPLEPTNEAYAIAKIAGIIMCDSYNRQYGTDFIAAMPTNLYGPGDNFDLETSHVLPALIRKFHEAKTQGRPTVELWGTGKPRREFLHVDDLADAVLFMMDHFDSRPGDVFLNVGVGEDVTIAELADLVARVVGFDGDLVWNSDKPDGTPRKLLDVSRLAALGWQAHIGLEEGLAQTYQWFLDHIASARM